LKIEFNSGKFRWFFRTADPVGRSFGLHAIDEMSRIEPQIVTSKFATEIRGGFRGHWRAARWRHSDPQSRRADRQRHEPGLPSEAARRFDSRCEYISSAGLRALMMGSKQAKAVNGRLAVAALGPVVKEIFEISRFSLVVQVFDTSTEALAALR
jgi:hypothetical protein